MTNNPDIKRIGESWYLELENGSVLVFIPVKRIDRTPQWLNLIQAAAFVLILVYAVVAIVRELT